MAINRNNPSLCNHLNATQSSCFLQVSLISENQEFLEKSSFPFLEAGQSDPLQRLIKGKFITSAHSEIEEVFLLVQRDNYLIKKDELWPLTNLSIEESWHKALVTNWEENSSIFLSKPVNEDRELASPWEPLFFCKKQRVFFPILCPHCGLVGQLCRDDDLLAKFKLPPYSQSLERYLYCPSCIKKGRKEFFTYASGNADFPFVKDRFALVNDLAILFSLELAEDLFPCKECRHQAECFGANNLAKERITPFSFYPFYMLIFKAMSLNAQEFIALLGGAKAEELQEQLQIRKELGRKESLKSLSTRAYQKANHLFAGQDNFFGEVLYLKLTFLNAVLQKLLRKNSLFNHPELRLSLDRIWVNLPSAQGLLPTFWDFQVEIIDLPQIFPSSSFPKLSQTEAFYFLGQLWLYTLLVNNKQKISQVYSAIEKTEEAFSSAESFSFTDFSPIFWPQNIFWYPDNKKVGALFLPFWEEALKLGWSLLWLNTQQKFTLSPESFLNRLAKLRDEVKNHIFQLRKVEEKPASFKEDAAISRILKKVLDDLAKDEQAPSAEARETVILPPDKFKKEVQPPSEETLETVIISKGDYQKSTPPPATELEEEVIQTVILRPEAPPREKPLVSSPRPMKEEEPQTVILTPSPTETEDMTGETLIISPHPKSGADKVKPPPEQIRIEELPEKGAQSRREREEDSLSETVIIQPKKTSGKEKYGSKK